MEMDIKDPLKAIGWRLFGQNKRKFQGKFLNKGPQIDLAKHLYVCGSSGTGKTTAVKVLLTDDAYFSKYPFIVVEPTQARNYADIGDYVYEIGSGEGNNIELNPFYFPFGETLEYHINLLITSFKSMIPSKDSYVKTLITESIRKIYYQKGWDRITNTHKFLQSEKDYENEEHYYYFPRMQDLYDEIVDRTTNSTDFQKGGENYGTARELAKSAVGQFLSGSLGYCFNTYKNELYSKQENRVVLEIPDINSAEPIINILLSCIISTYSNRKKDGKLRHITVFEEAQLLFPPDKNNKREDGQDINSKLHQIITTARKFGEGIMIVNQHPAEINECVLNNISQRLVYNITSHEVNQNIASDFGIKPKNLGNTPKYRAWYREDGMYQALPFKIKSTHKPSKKEEKAAEEGKIAEEKKVANRKLILGYAGLENVHEQLDVAAYYLELLAKCHPDSIRPLIHEFRDEIGKIIQTQGGVCQPDIFPEYMSHLTCIVLGESGVAIEAGLYEKLFAIYRTALETEMSLMEAQVSLPIKALASVKVKKIDEYQENMMSEAMLKDLDYFNSFCENYWK